MKYEEMTDEELAIAYHNDDEFAFTVLFERYVKILSYKATNDHKNCWAVHEDIFYSYHMHQFWVAVRTYNKTKGSFKNWLRVKLSNSTYNAMKEHYYTQVKDANNRLIPRPLIYKTDIDTTEIEDPKGIEHLINESDTELFNYIQKNTKNKNIDTMIVLSLLAGYSYEEIAVACGRNGNSEALRNWTLRAMSRIRKLAKGYQRKAML